MLSCKHATHRAALRQNLLIIRSIAGRLGPRATEVLRGSEMTRMGWTGRAPALNGFRQGL